MPITVYRNQGLSNLYIHVSEGSTVGFYRKWKAVVPEVVDLKYRIIEFFMLYFTAYFIVLFLKCSGLFGKKIKIMSFLTGTRCNFAKWKMACSSTPRVPICVYSIYGSICN